MNTTNKNYENCIVLLTGFAGTGKRTIGAALSKAANFKFVHHHTWTDPVLNLLGDDSLAWWHLDEKGWKKINEARDVIFSTIADVSPKSFNFIITYELIDQDPYHQIFYDKLLEVVNKRQSIFLPVRLICDEKELTERVQEEDRKKYFKTSDVNLIHKRVREQSVFYSHHPNELTINNTSKSPEQVAKLILDHLDRLLM